MIKYANFFVPETKVPIETIFAEANEKNKLPKAFASSEEGIEFFKDTLGLQEVVCAREEGEIEMVTPMLEEFFEKELVEESAIDLLVLIRDDSPKMKRMPNLGHYIQHEFGLSQASVMQWSGNHCSNVEFAISYGESLLKSGDLNNILIVAVSKVSADEDRIIGGYGVQGDGAAIIYLNKDDKEGVLLAGKHIYTNGLLYEGDVDAGTSFVVCKDYISCVKPFIEKYNINPSDIYKIIIQNANYLLIQQILETMNFKEEQLFLENIATYGHLDFIDFVVNLTSLMAKEEAKDAKMISFGTGWAGSNICLYLQRV